jgi:hypothetical protein
VLVGLLAVAAAPAAIEAARALRRVTIAQGVGGAAVAATLLGLVALMLGRRARRRARWSISGSGGEGVARTGIFLGVLGICLGLTAALALGFFGLLLLLG